MKLIACLAVVLTLALVASAEQQRILRRVIKSTPTATNLARVRLVTIRSSPSSAESGAVTEISSKEAASFGQRGANETGASQSGAIKTKQSTQTSQSTTTTSYPSSSSSSPTTTSTTAPTTATSSLSSSTTTAAEPTTTGKPELKNRASERQLSGSSRQQGEVELLSVAPSSWQTMTAVEAPAAMLIATGTRAASSDLTSSSSEEQSSSSGDFLRASATKGSYTQQSVGETFARLRQQQGKTSSTHFYPAQQRASGKTSQATKSIWYQPTTSTTTPRPAPIIQQEQQYVEQQQNEQYVEQQQQQVEYGAAPLGQAEPFAFDFNTQDNSGNGQYRKEESDKNGVVRGSYGYTDANGIYRHVEYVADQNGFRANIKSNEPGLIGETQPASIQYAGGAAAPAQRPQAAAAPSGDNGADWASSAASSSQPSSSADLALVPPDFESSHKSERLRAPRHFRN